MVIITGNCEELCSFTVANMYIHVHNTDEHTRLNNFQGYQQQIHVYIAVSTFGINSFLFYTL